MSRARWRAVAPGLIVLLLIAVVVVLCLMAGSSAGATLPRFPAGHVLLSDTNLGPTYLADGRVYAATYATGQTDQTLVTLPASGGAVTHRLALKGVADGMVLAHGTLWVVSDDTGTATDNYCASAATGTARATLPPGAWRGQVLGADEGRLLYAQFVSRPHPGETLKAVAIPAVCR